MFKKIFKATVIIMFALAILGCMWDIPLMATVMKIVISAGLIAWIGSTIWTFKG